MTTLVNNFNKILSTFDRMIKHGGTIVIKYYEINQKTKQKILPMKKIIISKMKESINNYQQQTNKNLEQHPMNQIVNIAKNITNDKYNSFVSVKLTN